MREFLLRPFVSTFQLSRHEQRSLSYYYQKFSEHTRLTELDLYVQHGKTTCLTHSIAVAYFSVLLARRLRLKHNQKSLVIGALFHDYFLYDWHEKDPTHRLHGFFHPKKAYDNALKEFQLNRIEGDIIKKHMFPLTFIPPRYRESIIVCVVDKMCSTYEIFSKNPYPNLREKLESDDLEDYM